MLLPRADAASRRLRYAYAIMLRCRYSASDERHAAA